MATESEVLNKEADPYEEPLPGGGRMALVVPLIIGSAIVLAALVLFESHMRKKHVAEKARVEEEVRADLREGYRQLRDRNPGEVLHYTTAAEEKIAKLRPTWRTDFAELRMMRLMLEAEAEFVIDRKKNAESAERKFSQAMELMTHASGEIWQGGVLGRARARYELGRYAEAEADLTLLLGRNNGFGAAYFWRSLTRQKLGDEEGARDDEATARRLGSWPPFRDFMPAEPFEHRDPLLRPEVRRNF